MRSACRAGLSALALQLSLLCACLCTHGPCGRPRTRCVPDGAPGQAASARQAPPRSQSAWIPPGGPPGPLPRPAHPGRELPAPLQIQVLCPHSPSASNSGTQPPSSPRGPGPGTELTSAGGQGRHLVPELRLLPTAPSRQDPYHPARKACSAAHALHRGAGVWPSCLPAPETDTPARTHTARLLREVGTVHRSLLPHTGTSTTEPQPTHRHAHTHTQAPQSHTRDTHTHTLHTVYTHTAHGVGETEKHHRATPQTHTDTHSSHTHPTHTGVGKAGRAWKLGSRAGGEEREAGESVPGQKQGEQGSTCQSVLPQAADTGGPWREEGREG